MLLFALLLSFVQSVPARGGASRPACFCNELNSSSSDWRLYLVAKDPATWRVLESGAWGELTIHRPAGRVAFTGHGLRPTTDYALVRRAGQGPSPSGNVLVCGKSDNRGELRITGVWSVWSGKFWLVLGEDLQGRCADSTPESPATLKAWHPAAYLFETETLSTATFR